ncbi:hypothetical protein GCM10009550_01540 [Actinocorallia libanotica]
MQLIRCQALDRLRAEYPGWSIRWDGWWTAVRKDRRTLTDTELSAGMAMTLMEDTLHDLREALEQQEGLVP